MNATFSDEIEIFN